MTRATSLPLRVARIRLHAAGVPLAHLVEAKSWDGGWVDGWMGGWVDGAAEGRRLVTLLMTPCHLTVGCVRLGGWVVAGWVREAVGVHAG